MTRTAGPWLVCSHSRRQTPRTYILGGTMGFFDSAKNALHGAAQSHPDQVAAAIDKAEDVVNDRTGGQFSDQISAGGDQLAGALGVQSAPAAAAAPAEAAAPARAEAAAGQRDQGRHRAEHAGQVQQGHQGQHQGEHHGQQGQHHQGHQGHQGGQHDAQHRQG